ncbi:MAG: sulfatase-like hydrolase/transferase [Candidatus Omnitrophota bacterium]
MPALILSIILFFYSIFLYSGSVHSLKSKIIFFSIALASLILYVLYSVSFYFTGEGINESVIYHIRYGLIGAGFGEYLDIIIIYSTTLVLGLFLLFYMIFVKKNKSQVISYIPYLFILMSIITNPATHNLYEVLLNKAYYPGFYTYYQKPSIKELDKPKKNLVIIYAEGLERTYFNEDRFPGLIRELSKLESKSTYFTNITQVPSAFSTIGGLVASQCGIPLAMSWDAINSMSGMDSYLPSAIGLSDLLHSKGYKLIYYGGADLDFAGKGNFFHSHSYDEIYGKKELLNLLDDESYMTSWGLFDDALFDIMFDKFLELSSQNQRFCLVTLTLDTHHPYGSPSKKFKDIVYEDGLNPMLNAVASSDRLIADFVSRILKSPYAKQTIIVILSDHLAMRNSASNLLMRQPRRNMFMVIDPENLTPKEIARPGSTMDIGPTVLPFIGYKCALGLGRDLLTKKSIDSEIDYILKNTGYWMKDVAKFWDFPKIKKYIKVDTINNYIEIDKRRFRIPIFIELNNNLETVLKFKFNHKKDLFTNHLNCLGEDKKFIIIDRCSDVAEIGGDISENNGFCIIFGEKDKVYLKKIISDKNLVLKAEDLRRILQI